MRLKNLIFSTFRNKFLEKWPVFPLYFPLKSFMSLLIFQPKNLWFLHVQELIQAPNWCIFATRARFGDFYVTTPPLLLCTAYKLHNFFLNFAKRDSLYFFCAHFFKMEKNERKMCAKCARSAKVRFVRTNPDYYCPPP